MALEVTLSGSLAYDDGLLSVSAALVSRKQTSAANNFVNQVQSIGLSDEAIRVGDLATIGAYFFKNLDPTNIVTIKDGSAGHVIHVLDPDINGDGNGGFAMCSKAGSNMQAPYAVAAVAACRLEVLLIEQ